MQRLVNQHSSYTTMLCELIKSLLKSFQIKYHIVECRTKTAESLIEKISRKNIKSVTKEVTDISGIRIILYYQDDVDKVSKLINDNFLIDKRNSINKAELYDSNQFGYLSIHHIVQLNNNRKNLPEWKIFASLKAEIQIRTVLQHSWASISHELSYKKDYEIPQQLERRLYRLAGLFELADEQFLDIRNKHDNLDSAIKKLNKTDKAKELDINTLTLKHALEKTGSIFQKIITKAYEIGFVKYDESDEPEYGEKHYYYSEIILLTKILGYQSISELESGLEKNFQLIEKVFMAAVKKHNDWGAGTTFLTLIASLTLLNREELGIFGNRSGWHNDNFDLIVNAIIENIQ